MTAMDLAAIKTQLQERAVELENGETLVAIDREISAELTQIERAIRRIDADEYFEEGLSEYETELAGRPLNGGSGGGDDLSMLVAEEIVVSSDGDNGSIYKRRIRGDRDCRRRGTKLT